MMTAFISHLSLQKKFILVTSSAVILFMVVIGILITRRESTIMYRDIERQGRLLAETLAIPVMNDLLYERLGLVEEGGLIDNYVSEIFARKDIDIRYIAVLDETGRVISHNDFSEYGKIYDDPLSRKAIASNGTIVQKFFDSDSGHDALDVATPLSIGKKRWGTLKFAVSLERLHDEIQATVLSVIIVTLFLLLGGLGIIVLLSRRFIKPITELAKTMEKAGVDSLDVEVDIKGSGEIALLGQSFNKMIDRIRRSNLKIKQTHQELLTFIGTLEQTSGDLLDVKVDVKGCDEITLLCESFNAMVDRIRESNMELKKTHEKLLQSQKLASIGILASGVAHEINNPLGGLFNCVQMLQQKGKDDEFRKRYLTLLQDGLNRIENIVGRLLWMSRKKNKVPQVVRIRQSLDEVYGFIEYKIKSNNIAYREEVEDAISIWIDPYDLQQVLINLIINAIQSMKHGGILSVRAHNNNAKVCIEVSDTGEGIEKADIDKIFDPFYTTKTPGEGTGLGLWLAYEIVNNYDGEISVASTKGAGSTFTLTFNCVSEHETQNTYY